MIKISLRALESYARIRPPGYRDDVLSRGKLVGDYVVMDDRAYEELLRKYRPQSQRVLHGQTPGRGCGACGGGTAFPRTSDQVRNAAQAVRRVIGAVADGRKVKASPEQYRSRLDTCAACEHYDARTRRCRRCGCFTRFKALLATEHCPENKW